MLITNVFDNLGRILDRKYPTELSDGKSNKTVWVYNSDGGMIFKTNPAGALVQTNGYNSNRLTSMLDAAGTTVFTYNGAGDLFTEDGPWASDTVTYGYHANVPHLRASVTVQQPSSTWNASYGYDSARRLQTVTSPAGTCVLETLGLPASAAMLPVAAQKIQLPKSILPEWLRPNLANKGLGTARPGGVSGTTSVLRTVTAGSSFFFQGVI